MSRSAKRRNDGGQVSVDPALRASPPRAACDDGPHADGGRSQRIRVEPEGQIRSPAALDQLGDRLGGGLCPEHLPRRRRSTRPG
jgi:hypothetical protein